MAPTVKILSHNVPNCSNVEGIRVTESYNSASSQAMITCGSTSLDVGDSITFNMGFSGDTGKMFTGYVREIEVSVPDYKVTVTCEDILAKAVDYYIAANDPDNPFSRENVSTATLVGDILALADISSISASLPLSITWGTNGPIKINLISAWAAAKNIADMMAWTIYADRDGTVHLVDRKPYIMDGDSSSHSWDSSSFEILSDSYTKSTQNLRNKVVVYGLDNIHASASAVSPYLPSGFYKTAVIATPYLDTTHICQIAADYNLELFNRLTERATIQIEGDHTVNPREIATLTDTFTGLSGDWFIYHVETVMDSTGFKQNLTLTR